MRILFVLQSPEFLRFYDSTIHVLVERGHTVIVAANKQNEAKPVRLAGMGESPRLINGGVLPRRDDLWRPVGRRLRGVADFSRYLHPRFAAARALRQRMKHKELPRGFRWLDRIPALPERWARRLTVALTALERAIPPNRAVEGFIRAAAADVVVVSPLIDPASEQVEVVKSARRLRIPVAVGIASWDNLTNKGLLRVQPDALIVWNEAQRREAVGYHGAAADRVTVTGAQLFDRWFERQPSSTLEEFCRRVGLPAARPFILYTCSSSFIAISHAEVAFVRRWIARIRESAVLAELPVLVRPHPYNTAAWQTADFSGFPGVAVWPRQAYNPVEADSRDVFFDSLYHSAAVVGINTSAMIEAAILGRPVLSMLSDEFSGTQEGTLHFHHLLPENGGFLRLAGSLEEHVAQLAEIIANPDEARAQAKAFVGSFLRPHGIDRPATPIVADAIERAAMLQPVVERAPAWAPLGRALLLAAGTCVWLCNAAREPEHRLKTRKRVRGLIRNRHKTGGRRRQAEPQTNARGL